MIDLNVKMDPDPKVVIQRLETFSEELQDKALKSGLGGAAKVLNDELKKRTPRQPGGGALYKSIGRAQLSRRGKASLGLPQALPAVLAGPIRKVVDPKYYLRPGAKIYQGFKALWMEFGTKPHKIPSDAKRAAGKTVSFGGGVYSQVDHPGMTGTRFMSDSWSAAHGRLQAGFYGALAKRLKKLEHV